MRNKALISLLSLLFMTFLSYGQLDTAPEGFSIKPSDSVLKGNIDFSIKRLPIPGITTKLLSPKLNYQPTPESYKKTTGVDMTWTSTLKTPTWDVNIKFTEDYKDISQFNRDHNLGDIRTGSKTVIIQCRDHEYVDGDRIKLMVNNAVIHPNLILRGDFYSIDIDLKPGHNTINFVALNEGSSRPNTAQVRVYDENGNLLASNKWLITTGYKATLTVYKQ